MLIHRETILIRSPNWIGDAVVSTGILKPLRNIFQDKRIVVVAKEYVAKIFDNNPFIDRIIIFKGFWDGIKKIEGDIGIILPNSFSSALLFALSGVKRRIGYKSELRSFLLTDGLPLPHLKDEHIIENYKRIVLHISRNGDPTGFKPKIFLTEDEKNDPIFERFHIPLNKEPVIIDPGSAYGKAKIWGVKKYAGLIDYIIGEKDFPVVLSGSKDSIQLTTQIVKQVHFKPFVLTGRFSIRDSLVAISKCSLFISTDTGGMHIAAALGVPQIAIFGSSSPVWTGPLNKRSYVIYKDLPCSPCFKRICPKGTYKCFKKISIEDVIEKVDKVI